MKKIGNDPLSICLIFLIALEIFFIIYIYSEYNNQIYTLIIEIYGAFVATFWGVYFSLYYSKKEEKEKEAIISKKIILGTLKLIYSELDINNIYLKNVLDGLISMPRSLAQLYTQLSFIIDRSKGIKSNALYAAISSGDMHEISKDDLIFNAIQQAYYNIDLGLNGLSLTLNIYKDFVNIDEERIEQALKEKAVTILDKEIESIGRVIGWVKKAEKILHEYLTSQGITFTIDK